MLYQCISPAIHIYPIQISRKSLLNQEHIPGLFWLLLRMAPDAVKTESWTGPMIQILQSEQKKVHP
jgi:hypothetical protein